MLTVEQAQLKLSLMPLLTTVDVTYSTDMETEEPVLQFQYANIPGPGMTTIQVPLSANTLALAGVIPNLPITNDPATRLACVAIITSPPLPGNE